MKKDKKKMEATLEIVDLPEDDLSSVSGGGVILAGFGPSTICGGVNHNIPGGDGDDSIVIDIKTPLTSIVGGSGQDTLVISTDIRNTTINAGD